MNNTNNGGVLGWLGDYRSVPQMIVNVGAWAAGFGAVGAALAGRHLVIQLLMAAVGGGLGYSVTKLLNKFQKPQA